APDMHQAGEGGNQKQGQAQHDVQLVDQIGIDNQVGRAGLKGQDTLGPAHEQHHFLPVHVVNGPEGTGQSQRQLQPQEDQYQNVADGRTVAHPGLEQAPVQQQAAADK